MLATVCPASCPVYFDRWLNAGFPSRSVFQSPVSAEACIQRVAHAWNTDGQAVLGTVAAWTGKPFLSRRGHEEAKHSTSPYTGFYEKEPVRRSSASKSDVQPRGHRSMNPAARTNGDFPTIRKSTVSPDTRRLDEPAHALNPKSSAISHSFSSSSALNLTLVSTSGLFGRGSSRPVSPKLPVERYSDLQGKFIGCGKHGRSVNFWKGMVLAMDAVGWMRNRAADVCTIVAAALAYFVLEIAVTRISVPPLDFLLSYAAISCAVDRAGRCRAGECDQYHRRLQRARVDGCIHDIRIARVCRRVSGA
ncbi:hypothetical protein BN2476_750096 [Paraburkholderia piptadeniae]|uniref:Uncharacterized protein n=1 Tax=Paraburkholderia piptadeniae TaxID=1701573 RepID=A0A1N7SRU8_9BURK|nr:hypothetical protein BN2476_750096 [Paraburkholderia piptadeniae]